MECMEMNIDPWELDEANESEEIHSEPPALYSSEETHSQSHEATNPPPEPTPQARLSTPEPPPSTPSLTLLSLPPEIRLQIYRQVHLISPIHPSQLAPWLPNPTSSAYFLQAIIPGLIITRAHESPDPQPMSILSLSILSHLSTQQQQRQKLSPARPMARLPTALLRSCKQVYDEARRIPFHDNEFVFVNWLSSGVSAARTFSGKLAQWQREELRFARLEVQASDLYGGGLANWRDLCGFWGEGLRGLRVRIDGEREFFEPVVCGGKEGDELEMRERREWVSGGLRKLEGLRHLEVEFGGASWSGGDKVEWCNALMERLNEGREEKVCVLCVEKANREEEVMDNCALLKTSVRSPL